MTRTVTCRRAGHHNDHTYLDDDGEEEWCSGVFDIVAEYGPWQIAMDPSGDGSGFIRPDPSLGLPYYYIESTRVHEGLKPNAGELSWIEHMSDKIWAKPHLDNLRLALADAQKRWPRP